MLAAITAQGVPRILCLGDLVGYYANPNECIALIDQSKIPCVRGNHDAVAAGLQLPTDFSDTARRAIFWTKTHLTGESVERLRQLPVCQVIDDQFLMVHAALHPEPNERVRLNTAAEATLSFQKLISGYPGLKLCFFGHTHRPMVYEFQHDRVASLPGEIVPLVSGAFYLANPGSVGQSRTGDPRATFLVLDTRRQMLEFHRVPYDRRTFRRKAERAGLLPRQSLMRRSAAWLWHRVMPSPYVRHRLRCWT